MALTILSAMYANPEHTAIVATTAERGTVACSEADRPDIWSDVLASGVAVTAYAPEAATVDDIIIERQRRFDFGFDYDFQDARGVHHIGTTEQDMKGWEDVTKASNAFINTGSPNATLDIVTDTGPATVTATEWQQILLAATAARQPIWAGSFWLQSQNPIPADYKTNEAYWT